MNKDKIKLVTRHPSLWEGLGGLWVGLLLIVSSCDSYIDITPKGAVTVDSARQYYELIVNPMRCYNPASYYYLTDDAWAKESNILGYESTSFHGINFTFNEQADQSCWQYDPDPDIVQTAHPVFPMTVGHFVAAYHDHPGKHANKL